MKEFIERILNEYVSAKKEVFAGHKMGVFFRNTIPHEIYETGIVNQSDYLVAGSVGQGNWATVPWICIFDKSITTSATKGVYIVYLLAKDGNTLYLTFNQGCTEISKSNKKKDTIRILREKAAEINAKINPRGFLTDESINLGEGLTDLAEFYQKGTILYKAYRKGAVPEEDELKADLTKMMEIYQEYAGRTADPWWPPLSEYDPGITKDQWLTLLNNRDIISEKWLNALAMFYSLKDGATCKEVSDEFHWTSSSVTATCTGLAKRIYKETGCPIDLRENGQNRYYTILFQGKDAAEEQAGVYIWRLRPELYDALTEFNIQNYLPPKGDESVSVSAKEAIAHIIDYSAARGFSYDGKLIENFYLSLKSKPFVILAGTSGTGKTRLVRIFAEAIGAEYRIIPVRPDWSDGSDLFGHYDLNGSFIEGPVCECFELAQKDPTKPVFLCLDEMNLARVEYYFSDFLSVIESREKLEDCTIRTDAIAQYKDGIPDNLYIVGTVNMDETTFPFSKKVLDRANTIEFSYVDLIPDFTATVSECEKIRISNSFLHTEYLVLTRDCPNEQEYVSEICAELQKINQILLKANAHIGYRVRDEIVFYMLNNKAAGNLLAHNEAFDNEIMQKILPRIQGSSASVRDMLCELFTVCAADPNQKTGDTDSEKMQKILIENSVSCRYRRSAEKIELMVRRFEEDGFTSYWL